MYDSTRPWFAVRPALPAALTRLFWRSQSTAFSTSPPVASSARLQSIIPAPVISRSCLTRSAPIGAPWPSPPELVLIVEGLLLVELRLVDLGHPGEALLVFLLLFLARDLELAHRHLGRRGGGGELFGADHLARLEAGVGDLVGDQLDGADGIVVAGDDLVDLVRIAVGVGDGHDRDAQLAGLSDGDVLLARVHDVDRAGELLEVGHATEEALQPLQLLLLLGDILLAAGEATV